MTAATAAALSSSRSASLAPSPPISGATRASCSSGSPIQNSSPSGSRDLVAEERADAAAVDASHHLPEQVAVGDRVVAVRGPGVPQRLLLLERPDHGVPCEHVGRRELGVERRQSCLVAQQVAHRDPFLAGLRELGPVARDRKVDVELAALGEQVHARRGRAFRAREDELQRVGAVEGAGVAVGDAAPHVDDLGAVDVERVARAHLAVLLEVAGERVADGLVPRLDGAADLDSHDPLPSHHSLLSRQTLPASK